MKYRILIVEDNDAMREMMMDITEQDTRFEIIGMAVDGAEAFDLYKKHSPDIVTMDLLLPRVNGIEATRNILNYDKDAKIIGVSAINDVGAISEIIEAGAKDYLTKPFNMKKLFKTYTPFSVSSIRRLT